MTSRRPFSFYVALTLTITLLGCSDLAPLDPPAGGDPAGPDPAPAPSTDDPSADVPGIDAFEARSLDGSGNNIDNPDWGAAGQPYTRVSTPDVIEGDLTDALPASPRYISNRVFNDVHQNLFSERRVSQWGWLWGQFIDHSMGMRDVDGEETSLPFDPSDPLEEFTNEAGDIPFTRSGSVEGEDGAPEQPNTVSAFLDGWAVYGGDADRLEWLREGPVDGDLSNNSAELMTTDDGYLPTADARGDAEMPNMEFPGRLDGSPQTAVVTGDLRANENIALTGAQTLFVREHNRIVALLPEQLDEQLKFEIARRVVGAEIQFITYEEFLPTIGVDLPEYDGYDPQVHPGVSNEFATVGFRAHSMIHGNVGVAVEPGHYTDDQLTAFEELGIEVRLPADEAEEVVEPDAEEEAAAAMAVEDPEAGEEPAEVTDAASEVAEEAPAEEPAEVVDQPAEVTDAASEVAEEGSEVAEEAEEDPVVEVRVPLNVAFGSPELVPVLGLGELLAGMANRTTYRNDEQIDNQLRSVMFQDPIDDADDLAACIDGDTMSECFTAGVVDLGVADMMRALDHGMTSYNDLREAYGLERKASFTDVTGEDTDEFPDDPEIDAANPIDDPSIMEFLEVLDEQGEVVDRVRRTTLAARLRAIYGDVDALDPFTGMLSEATVEGTELGELELAMWREQFAALRDGDRFFYANDPVLDEIESEYGITFRRTLREVILDNTDLAPESLPSDNAFLRVD
ncbi:MAG TPA: peroxidase family protein [Euzebyales bacterium]|nr:peroxidase family protein [Euzebyales bacterium]